MTKPDRPLLARRAVYAPLAPVESFIVPLLRGAIEAALRGCPPPGRGAPALDVGCGEQPLRTELEALGYSYTGVDVHQNAQGSVDVVAAIDEPLPDRLRQHDPFALILCTEVLEHVADWQPAFINLAQLLAPGGRLIITCPHFYPPHEEPYDFWRPTVYAMRAHADAVGLRVLDATRLGDAWDILGTTLAVTRFRARNRSPLSFLLALIAQWQRRALLWALREHRLQPRVRPTGPLYLSTLAILEKAT